MTSKAFDEEEEYWDYSDWNSIFYLDPNSSPYTYTFNLNTTSSTATTNTTSSTATTFIWNEK